MIGPLINAGAVAVGGIIGAAFGKKIPSRVSEALPLTFGLASMGIGIALIMKVNTIPTVVLALLLGSLIGELVKLEYYIEKLSSKLRNFVDKPNHNTVLYDSHDQFIERYVALVVMMCTGGMGIFGALNEGITGDASLLITKAFLDLFAATIFAITLRYSVALIAIPQLVIQGGLLLMASFIQPLITPAMIADFSACGGMIMLATGLRICHIKSFPVANMLFGLILVMPISALWLHLI
ncbi:DUF554 domain-containing protein [Orbus sasakiae]|uniref:DUF554 domain-containing protein n=2 Tax=Orbus sasakiae TaxID=1078475 RepID=A0ABP9N666_9GAMM